MESKKIKEKGRNTSVIRISNENEFLSMEQMRNATEFINEMVDLIKAEDPDCKLLTPFGNHIYDFMGNYKQGRKYKYKNWSVAVTSVFTSMSINNQIKLLIRHHEIQRMILNPKSEFKVTDEELKEEPDQVERQKAEVAKKKG